MSEKPLDRLNYYNGQRLEAKDLRLEQEYMIRTRRWINKSLYSAGIASGLMVNYQPGQKDSEGHPTISVSPGLAFDNEGREIILVAEQEVPITQSSLTRTGGNYLVIQYNEDTVDIREEDCHFKTDKRNKIDNQAAWKGASSIRSEPTLTWSEVLPDLDSGQVAHAQVDLQKDCNVVINPAVRQYILDRTQAIVYQYALEGEKDIDKNNPKRIYFHIRGRQPNSVTFYLRAGLFSTLYYSELGRHNHTVNINDNQTGLADDNLDKNFSNHGHELGNVKTCYDFNNGTNGHLHKLFGGIQPADPGGDFAIRNRDFNLPPSLGGFDANNDIFYYTQGSIRYGEHYHIFASDAETGLVSKKEVKSINHTHAINVGLSNAGVQSSPLDPRYTARNDEPPLTYINDLQVFIDGLDVTANIMEQLASKPRWKSLKDDDKKLGNGFSNHPIIVSEDEKTSYSKEEQGTGAINLDFLPNISFTEGEHWIDLSVKDGGGRIQYNLYVE